MGILDVFMKGWTYLQKRKEKKIRIVFELLTDRSYASQPILISEGSEALGKCHLSTDDKVMAVKELEKRDYIRFNEPPDPFNYEKFVNGPYKDELEKEMRENHIRREIILQRS
ncbi:MAG: hypothetical protein KAV48_06700 [Methanomicrobia archaeon]|nr:hypothetical protein [Methanomicrobia archaeon]